MFDDEDLESIRAARTEWESETLDPFIERGERKEEFMTVSNHDVDRLYTPEDVADLEYDEALGHPGEEPYTRARIRRCTGDGRGRCGSSRASGRPRRPTSVSTISSTRATGLSTAFDMPSLMGIDSDAPMSEGEVGNEGVAVDTLRDMEILFDEIDVGETPRRSRSTPRRRSSSRCTLHSRISRASRARK